MTKSRLFAIAILGVGAIFSWAIYQQAKPTSDRIANESAAQTDYYFEDFVITGMGATGEPRHRIQAQRMDHSVNDDSSNLTQPLIEMFSTSGGPWSAKAEHGWISAGGTQVGLMGAVELIGGIPGSKNSTRALTRDLLITPAERYAETKQNVTVTGRQVTIKGTGMRAWLDQERIVLMSNVQGRYDTASR